MNDFFANLIERVHPTAPAIEPRRFSRFELPAADLPVATPAPIEIPGPILSAPKRAAAVESNDLNLPSRPWPAPPPETSVSLRPSEPIVPTIQEPSPFRSQPTPTEPREAVFIREIATRQPVPVAIHPEPLPPPAATMPERRESGRIVEATPRPPNPGAETDARPSPTSPIPLHEITVIPIIKQAGAAEGPAPEQPQRDRPESIAPHIEVTIGCVEVRAVTASAPAVPPRRAAKPSPPISLGDYLKQQRSSRA